LSKLGQDSEWVVKHSSRVLQSIMQSREGKINRKNVEQGYNPSAHQLEQNSTDFKMKYHYLWRALNEAWSTKEVVEVEFCCSCSGRQRRYRKVLEVRGA